MAGHEYVWCNVLSSECWGKDEMVDWGIGGDYGREDCGEARWIEMGM